VKPGNRQKNSKGIFCKGAKFCGDKPKDELYIKTQQLSAVAFFSLFTPSLRANTRNLL